ncbi:hypothetical protein HYH03_004447 [Edaphochlamys debaryana]|uniref:Homeobox domain-containing protein n=1 Tax=Edaphochlamys debaryana TaxID=47281 RepID=A0A836C2C9_9CHLO|nr:hypothetical protein HYH03_004447 [Edaphochlamys debaryana]|eukprot:KAG2497710.1 hypothetical protein HYH03_004447 [Edaphochlamys debaryana]
MLGRLASGPELRGLASRRSDMGMPKPQARLVVVCMGRNDGASGKKRRSSRSGPRRQQLEGPDSDAGLWYDADRSSPAPSQPGPGPSYARGPASPPGYGPSGARAGGTGSSNSSGAWERASSQVPSRGGGRDTRGNATGGRRRRGYDNDDDEEGEDTRGWWERPEERNLQAFAAPPLAHWQEKRLALAFAAGKRKQGVQALAAELDLDRSQVLAWFKEFALRPQSERDALTGSAAAEAEVRRREDAAREAAEAATGQAAREAKAAAAAREQGVAGRAGPGESSGFVPYYVRKQLGGADTTPGKRISGEAMRTLEAVYDRTPFPPQDVMRGLQELHRLPKETVTEWFAARRSADGLASSTQKRTSRQSLREKDRDLSGAFDRPEDDPRSSRSASSSASSSSAAPAPGGKESGAQGGLLASLGGAAAQQPQQPPEPTIIPLNAREMAALRSSLPSPNKIKGRAMAEKMGITSDADGSRIQVGTVQYVLQAPTGGAAAGAEAGGKVRSSWRYRAATAGAGAGGAAAGGLRLRGRSRKSAGAGAGKGESDGEQE